MAKKNIFEEKLYKMKHLMEYNENGDTHVRLIDDIVAYIKETDLNWFPCYKKDDGSTAKWIMTDGVAKEGERREITWGDFTEGGKVAKEGEIYVKYLKDKDNPQVKPWPIPKETFEYLYEPTDKPGIFKPKEVIKFAAQVNESIKFYPPGWGGGDASVQAGGYLIWDKNNPTQKDDIYPITEAEFNANYVRTNG